MENPPPDVIVDLSSAQATSGVPDSTPCHIIGILLSNVIYVIKKNELGKMQDASFEDVM